LKVNQLETLELDKNTSYEIKVIKRRNKMVNLISRSLWIAGVHHRDLYNVFNKYKNRSMVEVESYINLLSSQAIQFILEINKDFPFPYLKEEGMTFIYSMRRATPPPLEDVNFRVALAHLTELPTNTLTSESMEIQADAYLTKKKIFVELANQPSLVSNKACFEAPRSQGGRDYISRYWLDAMRKYTIEGEDDLKESLSNLGCSNPFSFEVPMSSFSIGPEDHSEDPWALRIGEGYPSSWKLNNKHQKTKFKTQVWAYPREKEKYLYPKINVPEVEVLTESVDVIKQLQVEWASKQLDSFRLFTVAYNLISNYKTMGLKPWLYALDIKERGNKHRIPNIPEWHNQVAANYIGDFGKVIVSRLCPNTFKEMNPILPISNYYYSGDFKSATDYIPFDVARGAWKVILDRLEILPWLKDAFSEILDYIIGPHIITWDREHRLNYSSIYSKKLQDYEEYVPVESFSPIDEDDYFPPRITFPCYSSCKNLVKFHKLYKETPTPTYENEFNKYRKKIVELKEISSMNLISLSDDIDDATRFLELSLYHVNHEIRKTSPYYKPPLDEIQYLREVLILQKQVAHSMYSGKETAATLFTLLLDKRNYSDEPNIRPARFKGEKGIVIDPPSFKKVQFQNKVRIIETISNLVSSRDILSRDDRLKRGPLALTNRFNTSMRWVVVNSMIDPSVTTREAIPSINSSIETTKGIYMCYGISFPALTLINHINHYNTNESKLLYKMIGFATVGDDNASGHENLDSINKLETSHESHGLVLNKPKSWISSKGYLIAEKIYVKKYVKHVLKIVELPNFKARILSPKDPTSAWLYLPQISYENMRFCSFDFKLRVLSTIYRLYERDYKFLLRNQFNIFEIPIQKPIFPISLFRNKGNFLYDAFKRGKIMEIRNICTIPTPDQGINRGLMRELIDFVPFETKNWSRPDFGLESSIRLADKQNWSKGDLLSSLTARCLNNPYRNPKPPPPSYKLTSMEVFMRFLSLKGKSHMNPRVHRLTSWDDEVVNTSLMGILSGETNFESGLTYGNEIYDHIEHVYLIDGRSNLYGCNTFPRGEFFNFELQVLSLDDRYESTLFVVLTPPFGNRLQKDRQLKTNRNFFCTWTVNRDSFSNFVNRSIRAFKSAKNLFWVSRDTSVSSLLTIINPESLFSPSDSVNGKFIRDSMKMFTFSE